MNNRTNRKPYAREVSKEYLQKLGVEYVSKDGTLVIVKGQVAKLIPAKNSKKGDRQYFNVRLYDDNHEHFDAGIHVLNFVWNSGKTKPAGMVVDHIDNDASNNDISNLQCITVRENLAKEKANWNVKETPCQLNKPRSFYEEKLAKYEALYEEAKANHDADKAHKLRANISQCRARLRYYDNHIEEAEVLQTEQEEAEARKREYHERAQKVKELKAKVDSARKYYKEIARAYGKDDPIVYQYWGEWKLAIAMLHGFQASYHKQSAKLNTGENFYV